MTRIGLKQRNLAAELKWMLKESLRYALDSLRYRRLSLFQRRQLIEKGDVTTSRRRKFHLLLLLASRAERRPPRSTESDVEGRTGPPYIFKLPTEIQFLLINHLNFLDIRSFRQTCKYYHGLFNSTTICHRFGGPSSFREELDMYCRVCHSYPIWTGRTKTCLPDGSLFRAVCWYCRPGKFFCKWCGFEIDGDEKIRDFHPSCFQTYLCLLWSFYLLGWVQFALTIAGLALAWKYYKNVPAVVGPATVSQPDNAVPTLFVSQNPEHCDLELPPFTTHRGDYVDVVDFPGLLSHLRRIDLGAHEQPDRTILWKFIDWLTLLSICWAFPQSVEITVATPFRVTFFGAIGRFSSRIAANLAPWRRSRGPCVREMSADSNASLNMRAFIWTIAASWLSGLGTALAIPDTHVIHEQRNWHMESGLLKRSKPDQRLQLPMRIGLKQSNLDQAPQWLMDVSHPKSEKYGKHWSSEEIIEAFKPADDTIESVKQWLKDNGITEERITHTGNKVWLAFEASLEEAENLLHTEYFVHENSKGRLITDSDNYAIPKHLVEHIDYITPGVKGSDVTGRLRRSEDVVVRSDRRRLRPFQELDELSTSQIEADAAGTCATAISPVCLQALYQFDPLNSTSKVSANNSMGIFEEGDYYAQADLNSFYTKYASYIPSGWGPKLNGVDGGTAPVAVAKAGGESNLDFELAIPIIYPQTTVDYQTDDAFYAAGGGNATGIFNTFFDALDGSYCTYCSNGECGNDPVLDPTYPDTHTNGYKGELQCGVYTPTNVISISYGEQESDLPAYYQQRQCNEFLKLGLQGVSIFVASGDTGVAGYSGSGSANGCLKNGKVFSPTQPNSCPWLTNVGSTYIPAGSTVNDPEVATTSFGSGGGFSNVFPVPDYQAAAVQTYYDTAKPTYAYYTNGSYETSTGVYNRDGRGIPDVAANGDNIAVYVKGRLGTEGGTSAASPIFAAVVTRINEERLAAGKSPVGFVNPTLYENPGVLNDIVTGNNPGCGTKGFSCAKGWDPVTGLGTPNYPKMLDLFLSLP
ncbi:putative Peptidase S53 domain-containing protein [Seiridium unicorne]|uniref:Peptidase S53 domain-containing protein n=1 Tax=Seiridium unicorne TaxID=138068 RepID=A0ABR2UST4_9PEZI